MNGIHFVLNIRQLNDILYCKWNKIPHLLRPKSQISNPKFQEKSQSRPCLPAASRVFGILFS